MRLLHVHNIIDSRASLTDNCAAISFIPLKEYTQNMLTSPENKGLASTGIQLVGRQKEPVNHGSSASICINPNKFLVHTVWLFVLAGQKVPTTPKKP